MKPSQQFIIVSNRLPVSVSKVDGTLTFTPSSGGLATAMSSLDMGGNQLWIGWPGISSDDLTSAEKATITRKLKTYGCLPVFLTEAQIKNYYDGYANETLWPLFHYVHSLAVYNKDYWIAYKEVNAAFKKAVLRHAEPDATVWVHDYHLMLLPKMLRQALPQSSIGFFLHIPFPSFEIFRLLPDRKEILEGLLGADLVGFHIYDYARHFTSSVLRTLGHESYHGVVTLRERQVVADAFPIGVDYKKIRDAVSSPGVKQEIKALDEHYSGQKMILSVDRLDYSKGIAARLEAFEHFLERNPQYHKKVALVVVAVPSRIEIDSYKDLRDNIEQTVSRINGRYATVDWTPISYQFKNLPFEQVIALFGKADVALVTPLRDGMNLVAKEYVAAKQHNTGVLILSEMTGAVDELPEAVRINPNNTEELSQAIKQALTMPKNEQRHRLKLMQRRLSHYTVQRWAADFTEQLARSKQQLPSGGAGKVMSADDRKAVTAVFRDAKRRSILLDYDGTLRDFVSSPNPKRAAPPKSLLRLLKRLAALPRTEVTIISGRTRLALDDWFKDVPINLVAEHGFWVKRDGEWASRDTSFKAYKQEIMPMLQRTAERTPGAEIEEKDFSLVWHYRNVTPELAYVRNSGLRHDLNSMLSGTEVGVFNGNKVIEVKPLGVNKGTAANELSIESAADFILCMGDDRTDEDMFEALGDTACSVKVGPGDTYAQFQLLSVDKVMGFLGELVEQGA